MTWNDAIELISKYAGLFLTTTAGGWVGAYIGAYLKKSGENRAIHENLKKLLQQTSAVTEVTKKIEANISIDLWSRQQRWDVQKSALLESLKELASAEALLWAMVHACSGKDRETTEGAQRCKAASDQYMNAINAFWRTQLAMSIVSGKQISDKFEKIDRLMAVVRNKTIQGATEEIWGKYFEQIQAGKRELGAVIRNELEFDPNTVAEIPQPPTSSQ